MGSRTQHRLIVFLFPPKTDQIQAEWDGLKSTYYFHKYESSLVSDCLNIPKNPWLIIMFSIETIAILGYASAPFLFYFLHKPRQVQLHIIYYSIVFAHTHTCRYSSYSSFSRCRPKHTDGKVGPHAIRPGAYQKIQGTKPQSLGAVGGFLQLAVGILMLIDSEVSAFLRCAKPWDAPQNLPSLKDFPSLGILKFGVTQPIYSSPSAYHVLTI